MTKKVSKNKAKAYSLELLGPNESNLKARSSQSKLKEKHSVKAGYNKYNALRKTFGFVLEAIMVTLEH